MPTAPTPAHTPLTTRDRMLLPAARIGLGVSAGAFGVGYVAARKPGPGLVPLPPWLPGGLPLALLAAILLLGAAVCLVSRVRVRTMSALLGCVLAAGALLWLTRPHAVLVDAGNRTGLLEPLTLAAAAWLLASATPSQHDGRPLPASLPAIARTILALTLIVFGLQHFEVLSFVASLIPHWLGVPRFWTAFTGLAFIAAGLSIATGVFERAAGFGLAAMFASWLLVLHGPRIAAHPAKADEWTSGFVALGFLATGLLIAALARSPRARG